MTLDLSSSFASEQNPRASSATGFGVVVLKGPFPLFVLLLFRHGDVLLWALSH